MSGSGVLRAPAPESRVGPRASAWIDGRWEHGRFDSGASGPYPALNLDYGLYLPPGEAAAGPDSAAHSFYSAGTRSARPSSAPGPALVVMLHGCQQSGDMLARGTRMNVLADRHGFAVLYPDQTVKRHAHACWHWYDPGPLAGGGEAHAIAAMVAQVVETHGFDPTRVYVAGLSAGAGMAATLAFRYPQQFAALAMHSGPAYGAARSVTSALDVMRRGASGDPLEAVPGDHPGMPALIIHGAHDEVVNPINLAQLRLQMLAVNHMLGEAGEPELDAPHLAAGCACVPVAAPSAAQIHAYRRADRTLVQTCLVPELGHAWSGGDDTVPYHAAIGPDASALAWSFFSAHRRLPARAPAAAAPAHADTV